MTGVRLGGKIKPDGFRGQKLKADEAEMKRTRVKGRFEEGKVGRAPVRESVFDPTNTRKKSEALDNCDWVR